MDTLDKFLKQYSYKFDKGYPDMNNPKDKNLLEKLYNQYKAISPLPTARDPGVPISLPTLGGLTG